MTDSPATDGKAPARGRLTLGSLVEAIINKASQTPGLPLSKIGEWAYWLSRDGQFELALTLRQKGTND